MFDILTIIGTRPQFIKAAPVSKIFINEGINEIIINTGQHYDWNMSKSFFDELELPEPDINLGVGSGTQAQQTGQIMIKYEELLMKESSDICLVSQKKNATQTNIIEKVMPPPVTLSP